ncbi:neural/ectodermal development factor IMP-L2 isoform X1 [Helicoverpa armigera]|uniref:neural/ectodermal development factor IMP-L2 isoform X1 n=1 Tax=Helicoverpa armigera TaxID=29058 RepID=UPI00308304AD
MYRGRAIYKGGSLRSCPYSCEHSQRVNSSTHFVFLYSIVCFVRSRLNKAATKYSTSDIYYRIATMMTSLSLLAAVLVSLLCTFTNAHVADSRKALDNNIQPNAVTPRRRHLRDMVRIRNAPPETVQFEPGTRLVLECEVLGKPAPTVQWLKNGEPVVDYEVESNDILPADPSSFAQMVSKLVVTSTSNGDIYTCVATSALNQKTASTTVFTVEESEEENLLTLQKLFRMPSKPVITSYYTNIFQNIGSDVVLPCRVDSTSKSQVFWQDNNDELVFGNSRMRVLPSGDLVITPLLWSDMGNFTCIAKNMYGKDTMTTFMYPLRPSKV